ncbi:hypothetical protein PWT90_11087 [Aphanocladium album]|nr:hypothetical protein PWT90_11087 [Aphanocladium album]
MSATIDKHVYYDDQYKVMLYRDCRTAVPPGQSIARHLRNTHSIKGQDLKEIMDYTALLDMADIRGVPRRPDYSPPHTMLRTEKGFSCTECRYLTITRDAVTRHWRTSGHTNSGEECTRVQLQSWQRGKDTSYWIIQTGSNPVNPSPPSTDQPTSVMDTMIEETMAEFNEETRQRVEIGDGRTGLTNDTTWVKEMKWAQHFSGKSFRQIYEATQSIRSAGIKGTAQQSEDETAKQEAKALDLLTSPAS